MSNVLTLRTRAPSAIHRARIASGIILPLVAQLSLGKL